MCISQSSLCRVQEGVLEIPEQNQCASVFDPCVGLVWIVEDYCEVSGASVGSVWVCRGLFMGSVWVF